MARPYSGTRCGCPKRDHRLRRNGTVVCLACQRQWLVTAADSRRMPFLSCDEEDLLGES